MAIDDLREFRDEMAHLVLSFGGEMDSPQRKSYARQLEPFTVEIIHAAISLLEREASAGRQFFPMPTPIDVRGACLKVLEQKRRLVREHYLANCEHASQWEHVDGKEQRCACWHAYQRALEPYVEPASRVLPARITNSSEVA